MPYSSEQTEHEHEESEFCMTCFARSCHRQFMAANLHPAMAIGALEIVKRDLLEIMDDLREIETGEADDDE